MTEKKQNRAASRVQVERFGDHYYGDLGERLAGLVGAEVSESKAAASDVEITARHGLGGEVVWVPEELFCEHADEIRSLVAEENTAILEVGADPDTGVIPDFWLPAGAWVIGER